MLNIMAYETGFIPYRKQGK